jgi:hypothetical protein
MHAPLNAPRGPAPPDEPSHATVAARLGVRRRRRPSRARGPPPRREPDHLKLQTATRWPMPAQTSDSPACSMRLRTLVPSGCGRACSAAAAAAAVRTHGEGI